MNTPKPARPNSPQTTAAPSPTRRRMKFSYPSGSTPLNGYTIKRGIGIGGFGEVYFALSQAGKEVALKKIQRNLDIELRGVRQCLNLKHVNLISLWDIRTNEHGESWVVMEYVPGPSLRDVVEANPKGMPEDEIKLWFISTAAGCAYLHEKGIVHRDLKPGNIFCDEDQKVIKIGDYGLSKFISCSRRSGQTESVGTFHYMAPEIGKGVYGKEIDVYALGIILFEMLTGDVPFDGESTQEIIMKHLTADPEVDAVPWEFRDVIRKALRKDPELRYNNVVEMVADLPWPEFADGNAHIVASTLGRLTAKPPAEIDNPAQENNVQEGEIQFRTANKSTHVHINTNSAVESTHIPTDTTQGDSAAAESIAVDVDEAATPNSGAHLPPVLINSDEVILLKSDIVFGPLHDSNHGSPSKDSATADPIQVIDRKSERGLTIQAVKKAEFVSATDAANEPIARAMHTGFAGVANWWNNANVSVPVKIAALIVVSIVIIKNSQWLLMLALGLAAAYLVYYAARTWLSTKQIRQAEANGDSQPLSRRELKLRADADLRHWIAEQPPGDRATELLGSMLIGAVACLVLNLLGLAIGGSIWSATIHSWAIYAWLATTSVAAVWSLLIIGKFWEHRSASGFLTRSSLLRRTALAGIGIIVGAIAFFSAGAFSIDLSDASLLGTNSPFNAFIAPGIPLLPAFLMFFIGMFGILRWWNQTDPARTTRLSVWAVGLCLIWAAVFSHVLAIPMTTNCILAIVVSVAIQLASPWISQEARMTALDRR